MAMNMRNLRAGVYCTPPSICSHKVKRWYLDSPTCVPSVEKGAPFTQCRAMKVACASHEKCRVEDSEQRFANRTHHRMEDMPCGPSCIGREDELEKTAAEDYEEEIDTPHAG